ncbi:MAG: TldD/PmbA family protein, partial [Clostridiales bacterium]|nr:TldD/PmbA family protein [Clostridiales bacterium]
SNGDFSGVAKNSFFIRDGKIAEAVSETMISGNLEHMFKKVRGISSERVEDGQSVLPYIAVDGITISGK